MDQTPAPVLPPTPEPEVIEPVVVEPVIEYEEMDIRLDDPTLGSLRGFMMIHAGQAPPQLLHRAASEDMSYVFTYDLVEGPTHLEYDLTISSQSPDWTVRDVHFELLRQRDDGWQLSPKPLNLVGRLDIVEERSHRLLAQLDLPPRDGAPLPIAGSASGFVYRHDGYELRLSEPRHPTLSKTERVLRATNVPRELLDAELVDELTGERIDGTLHAVLDADSERVAHVAMHPRGTHAPRYHDKGLANALREARGRRLAFRPQTVTCAYRLLDAVDGLPVEDASIEVSAELAFNMETRALHLPHPLDRPTLAGARVTLTAEGYQPLAVSPDKLGRYDPSGAPNHLEMTRLASNIVVIIPASPEIERALGGDSYLLLQAFLRSLKSALQSRAAEFGYDSVEFYFARDTQLIECDVDDLAVAMRSGVSSGALLRGRRYEEFEEKWSPYSDEEFGSRIGMHTAVVVVLGDFVLPRHLERVYDKELKTVQRLHVAYLTEENLTEENALDGAKRAYCNDNSDSHTIIVGTDTEAAMTDEGRRVAEELYESIDNR